MRTVINELCHLYGIHNNAVITNWVNRQYLFAAESDGVKFTLHDVDDAVITRVINSVCTELSLTLDMLLQGVWIVPALTNRQLSLSASAELRPELFKMVLGRGVQISNEGSVYSGDVFERYGADSHVIHTTKAYRGTEVEAMFFNAMTCTGAEQLQLSCVLQADELAETKRIYLHDKFCGANPFTDKEWLEIQLAAVYRRFHSESMFSAVEYALTNEDRTRYAKMAMYGHDMIAKNKEEKSTVVYSDFGKPIATKVFRTSATKHLALKNASSTSSVVPITAANTMSLVKTDETGEPDDVVTEWGQF